jgi:predicted dehydrogenase
VAILAASRVASRPVRTAEVVVPGCRLTADFAGPALSLTSRSRGEPVRTEAIQLDPADSLGAEITAFLASVAGGAPALVDGRAGLDAVRVADMILTAIARRASSPKGDGHS